MSMPWQNEMFGIVEYHMNFYLFSPYALSQLRRLCLSHVRMWYHFSTNIDQSFIWLSKKELGLGTSNPELINQTAFLANIKNNCLAQTNNICTLSSYILIINNRFLRNNRAHMLRLHPSRQLASYNITQKKIDKDLFTTFAYLLIQFSLGCSYINHLLHKLQFILNCKQYNLVRRKLKTSNIKDLCDNSNSISRNSTYHWTQTQLTTLQTMICFEHTYRIRNDLGAIIPKNRKIFIHSYYPNLFDLNYTYFIDSEIWAWSDGSSSNKRSAWGIWFKYNSIYNAGGRTYLNHSTLEAELLAIEFILTQIPMYFSIRIFSDSQISIQSIINFNTWSNARKNKNINRMTLRRIVKNLSDRKTYFNTSCYLEQLVSHPLQKLQEAFNKHNTQKHQKISQQLNCLLQKYRQSRFRLILKGNDMADSQAKKYLNSTIPNISFCQGMDIFSLTKWQQRQDGTWRESIVTAPPRHIIKHKTQDKFRSRWHTQNNLMSSHKQLIHPLTFELIKTTVTTLKKAKQKTFFIRLLTNQLCTNEFTYNQTLKYNQTNTNPKANYYLKFHYSPKCITHDTIENISHIFIDCDLYSQQRKHKEHKIQKQLNKHLRENTFDIYHWLSQHKPPPPLSLSQHRTRNTNPPPLTKT